MKKIYYGIIGVLLLGLLTACQEKAEIAVTDNVKKETQEIEKKKSGEYVTLIRYNGECYHYNAADTLLEPEKQVGDIKSLTAIEDDLPTEDCQANVSDKNWIGKKIYVNKGEDAIYVQSNNKHSSGKILYECYVKGAMKKSEEAEGTYNAYVTNKGQLWLLKDKKRKIPKDFNLEIEIHSFGQYYMSKDYTTNLPELLGGKIYISEENENVIYVEAIDGRIWIAEPDES